MCLVVSSEDMPWLDITHSVVPKMMVVPSRYMMVTMGNTRVHREMRSSHGGSNKEGEEESSCWNSHGWDTALVSWLDCEEMMLVCPFYILDQENF